MAEPLQPGLEPGPGLLFAGRLGLPDGGGGGGLLIFLLEQVAHQLDPVAVDARPLLILAGPGAGERPFVAVVHAVGSRCGQVLPAEVAPVGFHRLPHLGRVGTPQRHKLDAPPLGLGGGIQVPDQAHELLGQRAASVNGHPAARPVQHQLHLPARGIRKAILRAADPAPGERHQPRPEQLAQRGLDLVDSRPAQPDKPACRLGIGLRAGWSSRLPEGGWRPGGP